jgi:hypothetical protein
MVIRLLGRKHYVFSGSYVYHTSAAYHFPAIDSAALQYMDNTTSVIFVLTQALVYPMDVVVNRLCISIQLPSAPWAIFADSAAAHCL